MNNEEKILFMLESLNTTVTQIQSDIAGLKSDMFEVKEDISHLNSDISEIKEDISEIRTGTNMLLDWADRTEKVVNVSLVPKAK